MNSDTHPELEQLADFNQNPAAAEHTGVRRHLAACTDCRQQLEQLNTLSRALLTTPPGGDIATLPDAVLHAIENNQLDDAQRRVLNDDPAALKAALHYAAHAPAMRSHFDSLAESPTEICSNTTHSDTKQRQSPGLLNQRPPAWGSIPLSAAAAFALALAVLPSIMPPPDTEVV